MCTNHIGLWHEKAEAPFLEMDAGMKTCVGELAQVVRDRISLNLWMIGLVAKQCVQKRLARWFVTSASGLHRNEDSVNLRQLLGIVKPHHPSPVGLVVHIKDAQIHG